MHNIFACSMMLFYSGENNNVKGGNSWYQNDYVFAATLTFLKSFHNVLIQN